LMINSKEPENFSKHSEVSINHGESKLKVLIYCVLLVAT
jgi:hypothetical protein